MKHCKLRIFQINDTLIFDYQKLINKRTRCPHSSVMAVNAVGLPTLRSNVALACSEGLTRTKRQSEVS